MEAQLLDASFETVYVVDEFESFIWTDRYDQCGDFELITAVDPELLAFTETVNYLYFAGSPHLMLVEDFEIESNIEDGDKLILTGRSIESLLDRRIVWHTIVADGNLEDAVYNILDENVIAPVDPNRAFPNFIFEASTDPLVYEAELEAQFEGENIYEVLVQLCTDARLGFSVLLNSSKELVFKLYAGVDRSYDQTENEPVLFSPSNENLLTSDYFASDKAWKNTALVGGEGEGGARTYVSVDPLFQGFDRRELFVDAGSISSNVDGVVIAAKVYKAHLRAEGAKKLAEYNPIEAFASEIDGSRTYGVEYGLGDIVHVQNAYGLEGRMRVTEVIFAQDASGIKIAPTFQAF